MKNIVLGIVAHVDAGKTTLSEDMMYLSGGIRKLGRVDHRNAFLDTEEQERERGITIFSKQAMLSYKKTQITLIDTPGHVDFSTEMERTLRVLDYAILLISGSDGIQGHTETLWRLLKSYRIPTIVFINKMDIDGTDQKSLMMEITDKLSSSCVDISPNNDKKAEQLALCDEVLLDQFLHNNNMEDGEIARAISERKIFPCLFGSALKLQGVDELMDVLSRYTLPKSYPNTFGAKIYKITRDTQGNRLTHMKITGGSLKVKTLLTNRRATTPDDKIWEEKVDQIRIYSGAKYELVPEVAAGSTCAVTGLSRTYPGEGLGSDYESAPPVLMPVLTYKVIMPQGYNVYNTLQKLKVLEEEDPQLHIVWNEQLGEIHIKLMGEIQLEILKRLIAERFGLNIEFGTGNIAYKETIAEPVLGAGHYEPLRHYAEVHLLLEPGERGTGLVFDTMCSEDILDRNWQRLVLTHLDEKEHLGVLTGSPITDMKITLVTGRAHISHTEGGDFRQATYRAVRQGLMQADSVLLEPYYNYKLEIPNETVGRAISDIQNMSGTFNTPEAAGDMTTLTGTVPVSTMQGYMTEVISYTKGRGRLMCTVNGYDICHNQKEVIANIGYDPESDVENTPDSVFCTHGTGHIVSWKDVPDHLHIEQKRRREEQPEEPQQTVIRRTVQYTCSIEQDKHLQKIFERTYGPQKEHSFYRQQISIPDTDTMIKSLIPADSYLLVDGYNIIFAWDELKALAEENLELARSTFINLLSNYQAFRKVNVILVFDAYKVTGGEEHIEKVNNIYVVYTREAEIADTYIEKVVTKLNSKYNVRVATSDGLEQLIVMGKGALRLSASAFIQEITDTKNKISNFIQEYNKN